MNYAYYYTHVKTVRKNLPGIMNCYFVSDLHGQIYRYQKLTEKIISDRPAAVFMGGDLLPHQHFSLNAYKNHLDFIEQYLIPNFEEVKNLLKNDYPKIFIILGNDDARLTEKLLLSATETGLWNYIHTKKVTFHDYLIVGYACVPPTPFILKDWEKYDISRYIDPGCIPPEEGYHSVPISLEEKKFDTIQKDLDELTEGGETSRMLFLFHSPPYQTKLDRVELDQQKIDHVPLEPHIGSVAIRKFIEKKQPLVTLHGHAHESTRLTGLWRDQIGRTNCFNAAHDGPELALIRFNPQNLKDAKRELI